MYNRVMRRLGIRGHCVPLKVAVEGIGVTLTGMRTLGFAGGAVSAPFKEAIISHLDSLSEGANLIGAANTIVCKESHLKGYNTNAIGFMESLRHWEIDVAGRRALVIGTGGVSRAVIFILKWLSARHVTVAGRRQERLAALKDRFGIEPIEISQLSRWPSDAELVINATPYSVAEELSSSGLAGEMGRLRLPFLQVVLDLNVPPAGGTWLGLATRHGARFTDGLAAMTCQARRTFALWTGLELAPSDFLE